ncbi:MAG TPA: glycosyltransferase family 4 protein, partial [Gemmataceae bacterium]|nr:glycosyltransferase family 4 protein [Gemmataceae bacterium]
YLAAEAARHTTFDRVSVIPTCVDPVIYPLATHDERDGIHLVWVGSHSTLRGLERFGHVLSAIGREVPQVRLKLICDQFLELPDLTIERCLWNGQTEAREIAAADVGISWVPDDSWSRGKCGLKVLQYQAAGLPVIANPVGVQSEMVRDNETGFLATTAGDWVAAVRRLTDAALRRRLGGSARREVEARYSVAAGARRWLAVLRGMAPLLRQSG